MDEQQLREAAWVGDAVLALFARRWILSQPIPPEEREEAFKRMTSNKFLAGLGQPTRVEAEIGQIYESKGLEAAFERLRETVLPLYQTQENKRQRAFRKTKK